MKNKICYLDNAATSFPKPKSVIQEVQKCLSTYCGNAGRGSHRLSLQAANKIYECRELICGLINAPAPENIVFAPSCSYGLNLIIKGALDFGDHVLISDMEHNSVLRPIQKLADEGKITFDVFECLLKTDEEIINSIKSKIKPSTKMLICNHQSNICSFCAPIDKIGGLCKKYNVLFVLDVAQSIGHYNIDMQKMNINYLSAPAHKGLYGLQGAGFVAINSKNALKTLVEGGNGIRSLEATMPDFLPERHEVGTLPLPSIVGLCEGIKEVNRRTNQGITTHERELFRALRDGLLNIDAITVYAPDFEGSTLSFNINNLSAERVCALLDEQFICLRAGFHCSALGHASLGTQEIGTVRASFGVFNTKNDVHKLLLAINNFKELV